MWSSGNALERRGEGTELDGQRNEIILGPVDVFILLRTGPSRVLLTR